MAAVIKVNMREVMKKEVKPVIKFSRKYQMDWYTGGQPDAEILVYDDYKSPESSTVAKIRQLSNRVICKCVRTCNLSPF